jgi:hypothetical protein
MSEARALLVALGECWSLFAAQSGQLAARFETTDWTFRIEILTPGVISCHTEVTFGAGTVSWMAETSYLEEEASWLVERTISHASATEPDLGAGPEVIYEFEPSYLPTAHSLALELPALVRELLNLTDPLPSVTSG